MIVNRYLNERKIDPPALHAIRLPEEVLADAVQAARHHAARAESSPQPVAKFPIGAEPAEVRNPVHHG